MRTLLLLILGAFSCGCSNSSSSVVAIADSGVGDATVEGGMEGGMTDAGPDTLLNSPVCPPKAPNAFLDCTPTGIVCEYGDDPNPGCNRLASCKAGGWSIAQGNAGCTSDAGLPSGCPATHADVQAGGSCTDTTLLCGYPEGRCACVTGPDAGPPQWVCEQPASGCSTPRPRIGESCSNDGLVCDYGACAFGTVRGGIAIKCTGGYWQETAPTCN
jgi:hypothetical protein